jgi:hypothetical protein
LNKNDFINDPSFHFFLESSPCLKFTVFNLSISLKQWSWNYSINFPFKVNIIHKLILEVKKIICGKTISAHLWSFLKEYHLRCSHPNQPENFVGLVKMILLFFEAYCFPYSSLESPWNRLQSFLIKNKFSGSLVEDATIETEKWSRAYFSVNLDLLETTLTQSVMSIIWYYPILKTRSLYWFINCFDSN